MDRKIFHESFYQKAAGIYTDAVKKAKFQVQNGVYSEDYIRSGLNQAGIDIQEVLNQGFIDTKKKLENKISAIVQKYVDQADALKNKDGVAELLHRQELQTKVKNYNLSELLQFIQNQNREKDVISEFDYYTLAEAAAQYPATDSTQSVQLAAELRHLRHKLPEYAAEQTQEYRDLKDQLTELKFTPHTGDIYIQDDTGYYGRVQIEASFEALLNDREE